MPNTTVITFLRYQDFFSQIEKRGLFIPISYLSDYTNIDNLVTINDFGKMIGKSRVWIYELIKRGEIKPTEIRGKKFIDIISHKDLLYPK